MNNTVVVSGMPAINPAINFDLPSPLAPWMASTPSASACGMEMHVASLQWYTASGKQARTHASAACSYGKFLSTGCETARSLIQINPAAVVLKGQRSAAMMPGACEVI